MIAYLKGNILKKDLKGVILLVGGVGYKILMGSNLLGNIKEGEEREFFIHFQQRDDNVSLYGLSSKGELDLFSELISVSGVGPKSGMHLVDSLGAQEIKKAIGNKRADILARTPGLGKKTAERIIVEMKNKFLAFGSDDGLAGSITGEESEAINALTSLGYTAGDARQMIKEIPEDIKGVENKIKEALKNLGRKR